jgi:hypothetical protein
MSLHEAILQHASPKTIAVALLAMYIVLETTQWTNTERKIRALGGHALRLETWLPWDISSSFVYLPTNTYTNRYS